MLQETIQALESFQLPEIPEGYLRLTHFTYPDIARRMIEEGEDFDYSGQVLIGQTTDAHSTNKKVEDLIRTGVAGAFSRRKFGSATILLDLDGEERNQRLGPHMNTVVANCNIVGYVERTEDLDGNIKLTFTPNPSYAPQVTELQRSLRITKEPAPRNVSYPEPAPENYSNIGAGEDDAW